MTGNSRMFETVESGFRTSTIYRRAEPSMLAGIVAVSSRQIVPLQVAATGDVAMGVPSSRTKAPLSNPSPTTVTATGAGELSVEAGLNCVIWSARTEANENTETMLFPWFTTTVKSVVGSIATANGFG